MKSTTPRIASGAIHSSFFFLLFIFDSSCFRKFVVNALQSLAQIEYRVALSRKQRVDAHSGLRSDLLKAPALQLVGNKDPALLFGQLADCQHKLIEKHVPRIKGLGPGS